MARVMTFILVLAALLVQLRLGALPADQMCLNFADGRPTCTCCGKKAHAQATRTCCRTEGCERCVRVPAPERQVAPQAKARTIKFAESGTTVTAMPVMVWRLDARSIEGPRCRILESPPDLARLRSTRLVL